jgi:hypothetical protein
VELSEKIRFGGYAPRIDQTSDSAKTTSKNAPSQSEDPLQPFFHRFFWNIAFVTQLRSSITLALVVSQLHDPEDGVTRSHLSDLSTVRIPIATSWVIFTVTHILSFFMLGFLEVRKSEFDKPMNEGYRIVALLYSLVAAAFVSLSLAVAAYFKVVGFLAVTMIGPLLSVSVGLFCLSYVLLRLVAPEMTPQTRARRRGHTQTPMQHSPEPLPTLKFEFKDEQFWRHGRRRAEDIPVPALWQRGRIRRFGVRQ